MNKSNEVNMESPFFFKFVLGTGNIVISREMAESLLACARPGPIPSTMQIYLDLGLLLEDARSDVHKHPCPSAKCHTHSGIGDQKEQN